MVEAFNKWWLLPYSILLVSITVAFNIVVYEPSFIDRWFGKAVSCSGALASDYACYQKRYQNLVHDSGVESAFVELKDESTKNKYVLANCHQLTHVIGRAAADLYGDLPNTYSHGDEFCGAGYYHGAIETMAQKIGGHKILDEANGFCADFREGQKYSYLHRNCVHGLGHGFMYVQQDELFDSLKACDTLADVWEKEHCYGGVFMQNIMEDTPDHPSKYLKVDQPLYPCTDVETKYKTICYKRQTPYLLKTQDRSFAKVFELCATVEDAFRPACYQGTGWEAGLLSTRTTETGSTRMLCTQGGDYEAQSNCAIGAVSLLAQFYNSDTQAKTFCQSFEENLRTFCLDAAEESYKSFPP
jgi:hypothetical protein